MEYLCCSVQSSELDDEDFLETALRRHETVAGVVVAQIHGESPLLTESFCAGLASRASPAAAGGGDGGAVPARPDTPFQVGNLTKTVAAAFALEVFADRRVDVDAPVNATFRAYHSDFQLAAAEGADPAWAEDVTIGQICEHTA